MMEIILIILLLLFLFFTYKIAKKKKREKLISRIEAEKLLPKPNYLSFIPEKDVSTFVPKWKKAEEDFNQQKYFEQEKKYEKEPIKSFADSLYPSALDGLLMSVYPLQTLSSIDWNVVDALNFSHKVDLSDYSDLKDFVSKHMINLADGDGWYTRLHGYVAEQIAASTLENAGHSVEFPETSNQPGFDLIVDGDAWQVKAGVDPSAITEHFEKYPDIPVITTPDMASHFPDNPMVVPLPELDHDSIKETIHNTMNVIDNGDFSGGFHFPFITALFSSFREINLLLSGRTDLASALRNAGLDILGTGLGGFMGVKTGALIGSVAGLPGIVIGTILGGFAGIMLGRKLTNEMKIEPFKIALQEYQEAMKSHIDNEIAISREKMLVFVNQKQVEFDKQLLEIEKYSKSLILAEKQRYQSLMKKFIVSFESILEQLQKELILQRKTILSSIKRSNKIKRFIWPSKNDIYYELVDAWFSSRLEFIRVKRIEYSNLEYKITSEYALRKELEKILNFVIENPFRNQEFEKGLANLEAEYRRMLNNIEDIRNRARIITEITRKKILDLIKVELMKTYIELTDLLKSKVEKVKPLYDKVVKEANKLGIKLNST